MQFFIKRDIPAPGMSSQWIGPRASHLSKLDNIHNYCEFYAF